jgi:hypothetical protein
MFSCLHAKIYLQLVDIIERHLENSLEAISNRIQAPSSSIALAGLAAVFFDPDAATGAVGQHVLIAAGSLADVGAL